MAKPRIVQVVRQCWPLVGGLEESVRRLSATLRNDCGLDVEILTLSRGFADGRRLPYRDEVDSVPIRRIDYCGSQRYPIAPQFLSATAGAALVHVHAIDFFFDGFAASRWLHGIPLVASTHGGFFHTPFASGFKQLYFNTLTRAACRAYDVIGASSENDGAHFRRIAPDRVEVIENGVDIVKWAGCASGSFRPTMLSIARWSPNKRVELLFPLLRAMRARQADWRLIIAGRASALTADDLARLAAEHDLQDAVEIYDDVDDVAMRGLLARSSFFISLSAYEGFGISAVEGLSAGLIPILSDIPPFVSLVAAGGTGVIVDPTRIEAAAVQITDRRGRIEASYGALRQAAIDQAQRYDWGAVGRRWRDVYERAIARKGSSRGQGNSKNH